MTILSEKLVLLKDENYCSSMQTINVLATERQWNARAPNRWKFLTILPHNYKFANNWKASDRGKMIGRGLLCNHMLREHGEMRPKPACLQAP